MISVLVEVVVNNCEIDHSTVKDLAENVLSEGGVSEGDLAVIFAENKLLRELKKQFFNQDVYTDVIAFRLDDENEPFEGEIYVAPERAAENAKELGEPLNRELARLVCHGCLHLLGHTDDTDDGKAFMRSEEDRILNTFAYQQILKQ